MEEKELIEIETKIPYEFVIKTCYGKGFNDWVRNRKKFSLGTIIFLSIQGAIFIMALAMSILVDNEGFQYMFSYIAIMAVVFMIIAVIYTLIKYFFRSIILKIEKNRYSKYIFKYKFYIDGVIIEGEEKGVFTSQKLRYEDISMVCEDEIGIGIYVSNNFAPNYVIDKRVCNEYITEIKNILKDNVKEYKWI